MLTRQSSCVSLARPVIHPPKRVPCPAAETLRRALRCDRAAHAEGGYAPRLLAAVTRYQGTEQAFSCVEVLTTADADAVRQRTRAKRRLDEELHAIGNLLARCPTEGLDPRIVDLSAILRCAVRLRRAELRRQVATLPPALETRANYASALENDLARHPRTHISPSADRWIDEAYKALQDFLLAEKAAQSALGAARREAQEHLLEASEGLMEKLKAFDRMAFISNSNCRTWMTRVDMALTFLRGRRQELLATC